MYLLIIAIKDSQWQGVYFKHDASWRTGKLCQFAGVLSMVSSEVSVAMLTIITADRLVCIVFPFRFKRYSFNRTCFLRTVMWLLGIMRWFLWSFGHVFLSSCHLTDQQVGSIRSLSSSPLISWPSCLWLVLTLPCSLR